MNILIPVPPKYEQNEIIEDVSEWCGPIDAAINRARREIELMREYRTRLISDVVTGKLDVRGVELSALSNLGDLASPTNDLEADSADAQLEVAELQDLESDEDES